jgi:hypothetical protein
MDKLERLKFLNDFTLLDKGKKKKHIIQNPNYIDKYYFKFKTPCISFMNTRYKNVLYIRLFFS